MDNKNGSMLLPSRDSNRLFKRHNIPAADQQSNCELVSPGSYQIKTGASGFLSGFLGSGVGVALYDEVAEVGGLIHLLLSKPIGRSSARHPGHYADSGLNHFINALIDSGAQKNRLIASVAGGILLGQPRDVAQQPDSEQELSDLVLQLLAEQQIPIKQVAVGGLNPSSMLLDTDRWQVTIKLFTSKYTSSAFTLPAKPTPQQIDQAIFNVKPIPQVALKVLQILGQERDVKFDNLAAEIEKDQVIAARVLQYCNSPVFGLAKNIDSIERALVLLGENNLLEIVISATVNFIYSDQDNGYALMKGGLYRHALATAYLAKEITFFTGCVEPGLAYTAGLIHDIGKIVLDGFVTETLPFFYQHLEQKTADLTELETRLFGFNHMQVGTQLARQWDLPESLSAVIRYHHTPEQPAVRGQILVHIIYLADLLASRYLAGTELERISTAQLKSSLAAVGLRYAQLPYIIDSIPWQKLMVA